MARRIELPSAEELFGEGGAPARKAAKSPARGKAAGAVRKGGAGRAGSKPAAQKKATAARKATTARKPAPPGKATTARKPATPRKATTARKTTTAHKPATPRKAATARKTTTARRAQPTATTAGRVQTQVQRLESIESRLSELPVDALIDLRDSLEELLATDQVDEQAVRRLLDTVEL